ncbi:MAG: SPOR domain-containing protein [Gemmatimonadetes bacterium]|nr:SPOR domain-containing protein [Gemmatimonadota bacterium]
MTAVQLPPAALDHDIPDLLRGTAVVALVPTTLSSEWTAEMAWRVARAAAGSGRRTALVDCFVDEPALHTVAGSPNDVGIVDAFEYGASLSRIVQPQPEPNLFFIAAGTFAPEPRSLMTHPRWRRLAAGFRHEGALLLLYLPADCLGELSADLDGVIALAQPGTDIAAAEASDVADALGRGLLLLAVVGEPRGPQPVAPADGGPEAAAPPGGVAAAAGPAPRRRDSAPMSLLIRERHGTPWGWYAALFALALGVAGYLSRAQLLRLAGWAPAAMPVLPRAVPAAPDARAPRADSLPLAIQVSAWRSVVDAQASADTLERDGIPTMISPVLLRDSRIWFRVYAGPVTSGAEVDSLRHVLRTSGHLAPDAAASRVPLSFALAGGLTPNAAQTERARLRSAGVPCFVLGQGDGAYRLFAGAFESEEQADILRGLLSEAGAAGRLLPRVGFVP